MVRGFKKSDNKERMVFATDKKQVFMVIFVFILFGFSLFYMFNQLNIGKPDSSTDISKEIGQDNAQLMGDSNNPEQDTINGQPFNADPEATPENLSPEAQNIYQKTVDLKKELQNKQEDSQLVSNVPILPSKPSKKRGKMIAITVEDSKNHQNPFLPASNVAAVQKVTYPVFIAPPPLNSNQTDWRASDLVNDVSVSGIMYDKVSPSAVIRLYNNDYLVKKSDSIGGFKILNISKNSVTMKYGHNVYTAGVGKILEKIEVGLVDNPNMNSKFGGNSVSIRVKKRKKY